MPLRIVRRHGSPNWYIRGTIRGVLVDESTGLDDEKGAEALRAKREWDIINGQITGRRPVATFLEAAVTYMEAGGEPRFVSPLLKHFGTTPLDDIDTAGIEAAARKLYPNASPSTRNRQVFTPVSAIIRHAAARGRAQLRPIERPRQPKGRLRWLRPEEAERLIAECADHLRPLIVFLLYTGARMGEALSLTWSEVDLSRAHVTLLDTKNGEDRGVPLAPRVVAELANLRGERDGSVFRRHDGRAYAEREGGGHIKTGFAGACRRAQIAPGFSPHGLRHTWATWHYAQHRDLIGLMRLGGWKSERMVMRYAHVNVADLAAGIEALPGGNAGRGLTRQERKRTGSGG